jgi:hypothetical protein
MSVFLVGFAAVFYLGLGLAAIAIPSRLLAGFGFVVIKNDTRNEIRAVYGGFPLAASALLVFSLSETPYSSGILLALAASTLGMAIGRMVSAFMDRSLGLFPAIFIVVEVVVAFAIASKLFGL